MKLYLNLVEILQAPIMVGHAHWERAALGLGLANSL